MIWSFQRLIYCIIFAVAVITGLYWKSKIEANVKNHFLRHFPSDVLFDGKKTNLIYANWYFTGNTTSSLYLGNYEAPAHLLRINEKLCDTAHVLLSGLEKFKIQALAIQVLFDSPDVWLMEGRTPAILHARLPNTEISRINNFTGRFNRTGLVSNNDFVLRVYDTNWRQNVLIRKNIKQKYSPTVPLLRRQIDGVFCTDGSLTQDLTSGDWIYTYYYRNQWIVFDTLMHLKETYHTIDTNTTAHIKIVYIPSSHNRTFSAPPYQVNAKSIAYQGKLFIHSCLKADNEAEKSFLQSSVIDVYKIATGNYLYSFYFPKIDGLPLLDFIIFKDRIIGLSEHWAVSYSMRLPKS